MCWICCCGFQVIHRSSAEGGFIFLRAHEWFSPLLFSHWSFFTEREFGALAGVWKLLSRLFSPHFFFFFSGFIWLDFVTFVSSCLRRNWFLGEKASLWGFLKLIYKYHIEPVCTDGTRGTASSIPGSPTSKQTCSFRPRPQTNPEPIPCADWSIRFPGQARCQESDFHYNFSSESDFKAPY